MSDDVLDDPYQLDICLPQVLTAAEMTVCVALVAFGGAIRKKVSVVRGLRDAQLLAVVRHDGSIVAVGAIKTVRPDYAKKHTGLLNARRCTTVYNESWDSALRPAANRRARREPTATLLGLSRSAVASEVRRCSLNLLVEGSIPSWLTRNPEQFPSFRLAFARPSAG